MKRALILLLLLGPASLPVSAAIDPFYRNRMESGAQAFERGDWEEADRQLRIACFGYLDEPEALAEGLLRLAVVKVMLGDEDAFRRVFSRIAEVEERFSAYTAVQIPDSLRRRFEGHAARLAPLQSLRTIPGFRAIAERADVQRIAALPPAERRSKLEAKITSEPDNSDWLLQMVRLELAERRSRAALDWLDRLPAEVGGVPPATCLRQQAASESTTCDRMDLIHPFCSNVPGTVVEFRLQCLVEAGRWPEAEELLTGLEPKLRARRRVARLERRVQKNVAAAAAGPPESAPAATEPVTPPAAAPPALVSPASAPPAARESPATPPALDPSFVQALRRRLAAAATDDELAALILECERLLDRHPGSRRLRLLAAEIAYLRSDWPAAVHHFDRAGELHRDEVQLAFYRAVALYESGAPARAAEVLRPVAGRLRRSSFVRTYVDRILSPGS